MGWWVVLGVVGVAEATAAVKWVVPSPLPKATHFCLGFTVAACCFLLLSFCAFNAGKRLNIKPVGSLLIYRLQHTHTQRHTHRGGKYPHSHSDLNANVAAGNETDNATYLSLYLRL